ARRGGGPLFGTGEADPGAGDRAERERHLPLARARADQAALGTLALSRRGGGQAGRHQPRGRAAVAVLRSGLPPCLTAAAAGAGAMARARRPSLPISPRGRRLRWGRGQVPMGPRARIWAPALAPDGPLRVRTARLSAASRRRLLRWAPGRAGRPRRAVRVRCPCRGSRVRAW